MNPMVNAMAARQTEAQEPSINASAGRGQVGKLADRLASTLAGMSLLGSAIALLIAAPGLAQVANPGSPRFTSPRFTRPMFTNLTLSPRFAPDPTYLRGISGGEQPTQAIAGQVETETGVCLGFVSDRPDHRLTLEQFFDYLNVQVLSEQATVMVIKGPGGTWCSDNRSIPGASVAGQWLPGRYEIWVGTAEADSYAPYRLQISEVQ